MPATATTASESAAISITGDRSSGVGTTAGLDSLGEEDSRGRRRGRIRVERPPVLQHPLFSVPQTPGGSVHVIPYPSPRAHQLDTYSSSRSRSRSRSRPIPSPELHERAVPPALSIPPPYRRMSSNVNTGVPSTAGGGDYTKLIGYALLLFTGVTFVVGMYALVISKWMPRTGNKVCQDAVPRRGANDGGGR